MMKFLKNTSAFATTATLLGLAICNNTLGVIPEPDNLLYGSITISNVPITATRTDVVIEARRTTNGPAIASYRMGSNPALGNFYSLSLMLESVSPVTNNNVSQVSDSVFVTVLEGGLLRGQTGFLITERGLAQRIDFGAAVIDGDGDGLPDAWELLHFAGLGRNNDSPTANGQTVMQNYLAGTDPNDPSDGFRLAMTRTNNVNRVSFVTRAAAGVGYEGLVRRYTLEMNPTFSSAAWSGVTGFIGIPGTNQNVVYDVAGNTGTAFFRGKIALESATVNGATNDVDSDGLPDNWEMANFGNLNTGAGSINPNGQTALQNYVAGTAPNQSGSGFRLNSSLAGGNRIVSFNAIQAQGVGYEGKQRFYALESSPAPLGPWQEVVGFAVIMATNQIVTFQSPSQAAPAYFRGRVWLQP